MYISNLTIKKKMLKASQARFDGMRKQVKSHNEIGNQTLSPGRYQKRFYAEYDCRVVD